MGFAGLPASYLVKMLQQRGWKSKHMVNERCRLLRALFIYASERAENAERSRYWAREGKQSRGCNCLPLNPPWWENIAVRLQSAVLGARQERIISAPWALWLTLPVPRYLWVVFSSNFIFSSHCGKCNVSAAEWSHFSSQSSFSLFWSRYKISGFTESPSFWLRPLILSEFKMSRI